MQVSIVVYDYMPWKCCCSNVEEYKVIANCDIIVSIHRNSDYN